jgi:hypothetical protein
MKELGPHVIIGQNNYLEDGSVIKAQLILPEWEGIVLTEVEEHEATHAVVGEEVHSGAVTELSVIPSAGVLGYVQMSFMSAEAAIAPDEMGMRGTGHDRVIVSHMKANEGAARSAARKIVVKRSEEIQSVGFEAHKKKRLPGNEVRAAIRRVHGEREVEVFTYKRDGTYQTFTQLVRKGETIFQLEPELLAA